MKNSPIYVLQSIHFCPSNFTLSKILPLCTTLHSSIDSEAKSITAFLSHFLTLLHGIRPSTYAPALKLPKGVVFSHSRPIFCHNKPWEFSRTLRSKSEWHRCACGSRNDSSSPCTNNNNFKWRNHTPLPKCNIKCHRDSNSDIRTRDLRKYTHEWCVDDSQEQIGLWSNKGLLYPHDRHRYWTKCFWQSHHQGMSNFE